MKIQENKIVYFKLVGRYYIFVLRTKEESLVNFLGGIYILKCDTCTWNRFRNLSRNDT